MIYFIMIILIIVIISTIIIEKKITNPIVIFSSIWLLSIFLTSLKLYNMIDYSEKSLMIISEGIISFILGSASCAIFLKNKSRNNLKLGKKEEILDSKILVALITIGLIFVSILSIKVLSLLKSGVEYNQIRSLYYSYGKDSLISNEKIFTIFDWTTSLIITVTIPVVIIGLINKKLNKLIIVEELLFVMLYIFCTAGRSPIFAIVIELLIVLLLNKEKITKKTKQITKIVLLFSAIIMVCMTLLRNSNHDEKSVNSVYSYLSIPMPYFSKLVNYIDNNNIQTYGAATAYGPYLIVQKSIKVLTGYKLENADYLAEVITKPQTYWVKIFSESKDYYNAYATMFYNFYMDFRDIGVIVISFIYGMIIEQYYLSVKKKNGMKENAIYLILISGLIKSFAVWQFASPTILIAFIVINIIFRKRNKRENENKNNNAKRILVFGITDNPGGIESVIMNYYRAIDRTKIQFDFLCNTEQVAYEEEIKKLGGQIFKIPSRSKNIILYHKKINKFFEENAYKYATIWVNICSLANIDYLKYAKKYEIKYRIIHCHNSQNMDSKLRKMLHIINRKMLKVYATDFWTCSNDANKWFFDKKIMKKNNIVHINNAIDCNKYRYSEEIRKQYREKMNLEDNLVFGHIGRFHFQKNQMFLLEIFNEIHKIKPDSKLILIGDGEDKEKILNKINQLKLERSIELLGVRGDVEKIIQAMDAIIFPSLFEGLSLVLVEAQANGISIFASDTISKETKIGDNINFISLEATAKEWAETILKDKFERCDNYEKIKLAGYDINTEKEKIEKLLMRD